MRPPTDRSVVVAAGGLAVAALLFAAALARALTLSPVPAANDLLAVAAPPEVDDVAPPAAGDDEAPGRAAHPAPRSLTLEALTLAVDNDPFQPDRRRPAEPYRMPGDFVDEAPEPEPPPPPPPFVLLGTAETADGGLAVLQVEEALPRVLSVGEQILGWRLDAVTGDNATIVSGDGRTLTLLVAQASPRPVASAEEPRARRGRGESNATDRERRQREQMLQRALEQRLGEQGDAAIEQLRRMIEQRGGNSRVIQLDDGRVVIRPRVGPDTLMREAPRRPPGG